MKANFTRILAIAALGLIAATVSAMPASAQAAFKGSFTLTSDVRWGQANLPAGDYTFTLESSAMPARIVVRGANGSQFVLTSWTDEQYVFLCPLLVQLVLMNDAIITGFSVKRSTRKPAGTERTP